jgi:Flp pilus assembly protein TadG
MKPLFRRTSALRSLARDRSGLALLEFAFALPIVLGLGAYGLEISNLAMLNLRVSQIALTLADNASRVGTFSTLSTLQLREVDMNDVLQAARYQGASINLSTNGRITLSSLENIQQASDSAPVLRLHWQRCLGLKSGTGYDSSYGISATSATSTTATYSGGTYDPTAGVDTNTSSTVDNASSHPGSLASTGMGDANQKVMPPSGSGVMFVEINYLTKPLFGTWLTAPARLHYSASYIVRDKRDFTEIYNPSPTTTAMTCNLYTS